MLTPPHSGMFLFRLDVLDSWLICALTMRKRGIQRKIMMQIVYAVTRWPLLYMKYVLYFNYIVNYRCDVLGL